jgi:predicted esterase
MDLNLPVGLAHGIVLCHVQLISISIKVQRDCELCNAQRMSLLGSLEGRRVPRPSCLPLIYSYRNNMVDEQLFPQPAVFEPISKHTQTIILLHGRGSTGQEFAEDLFAVELSTKRETLRQRFPNFRWVFPTAREIWSTNFQETMPAWFDAYSLTDISARSEIQVSGIKESVKHVRTILDEEIDRLENDSHRVIVGGISQSTAIGLWSILSETRSLGGFLARVAGCHSKGMF